MIDCEQLEADVWAMAYVVAEIIDGARADDVVNDLPHEVRRRVMAIRHKRSPIGSLRALDKRTGTPLPTPPSRTSVMRSRVRTIDAEPRALT